jgi:GNAT superfamily N-acetyltransferase
MGATVRRHRNDETSGSPGPFLPPDQVVVAGGCLLELRRLSPSDVAGLRAFYEALSAATLYRRFMTPSPRLPEATLAYLTETGRADREVVVATFHGEIVAEGRYHLGPRTGEAEVALLVADRWQGLGIGPALATWLARSASERGIVSFTGSMLSDNRAARRVLESLAPQSPRWISSGELEFRTPLPPGDQAGGVSTEGVSRFLRTRRATRASSRSRDGRFGGSGGGSSLVRSDSTTA